MFTHFSSPSLRPNLFAGFNKSAARSMLLIQLENNLVRKTVEKMK